MELIKAQVTNFRSVEDSEEFDIDQVTCLVGKNESGKSAILLALTALNPSDSSEVTLDKERDYPRRHLVHYAERHSDEDAQVIRTVWELDENEIQTINNDLGEGAIQDSHIEISRRYEQEIEVSLELDHEAIKEHHLKQFKLDVAERSVLKPDSLENLDQLTETLKSLSVSKQKHQQLLSHLSLHENFKTRVAKLITPFLPKFMYVSAYDRMDGAIQIEDTQRRFLNGDFNQEQYRGSQLFLDFLDYAGVPLDSITNVPTFETFNALLQTASNNITDQIFEYWSQNQHLEVEIRIDQARPNDPPPFNDGKIARARIKNQLHGVDTPFSERSAGFVWFFSFLVKFAQVKKEDNQIILVLDEPGLSLHGKAQGDLLRFIDEKLAPSHQVIYSTHSPFMVRPDKLQHVQIVEDKVDRTSGRPKTNGTKVRPDVLMVDRDTLFPLQGALGYEITQTLFVGKHTLLVEGPSDILYLQALSQALELRGRTYLDPRWTLCPAGSIDKIMPFVSLFSGNEMDIAVLTDFAHGQKSKVQRMKESEILKAGHFYTVADFCDSSEADIEDIFTPAVYVDIVNRSYELPKDHCITIDQLDNQSSIRIVKKVEALFKVMPSSIAGFNHYTPAMWLIKNIDVLEDDSEEINQTLNTAERIFKIFSELLNNN
ncbi:MAG: AAA family ATPase [Bacteroidetes bacterium]|nr:AAA family ATPase [Bacteroidota bacterium]